MTLNSNALLIVFCCTPGNSAYCWERKMCEFDFCTHCVNCDEDQWTVKVSTKILCKLWSWWWVWHWPFSFLVFSSLLKLTKKLHASNLICILIAVLDMGSRNFVQIQTKVTSSRTTLVIQKTFHSHTTLVLQNNSNSFQTNSCYTKQQ